MAVRDAAASTDRAKSRSNILRLPIPHPGQAMILNNSTRFRVVACGRRFGKTQMAKMDAIITASDGGVVWWVQPTYQMAQEVWNDLVEWLEPFDVVSKVSRGQMTIYFENGGALSIRSGHEPDRLRGSALDSIIIDEAAFCEEGVWTALRPALTHPGRDSQGKALFLSTPNGHNWFWQLFQKGLDPLEKAWVSWQMPTVASPLIPAAEIESARRDMPARKFAQEYLARFLDSSGCGLSWNRGMYRLACVCGGTGLLRRGLGPSQRLHSGGRDGHGVAPSAGTGAIHGHVVGTAAGAHPQAGAALESQDHSGRGQQHRRPEH